MKFLAYNKLSPKDQEFLIVTKKVALHSISEKKHTVGCVILCEDGKSFQGATVARTRAIGSTCAERMAADQWYYHDYQSPPKTCYLVGNFNRVSWKNSYICTPCGVCLEMFLEIAVDKKRKNIRFVCSNWTLRLAIVANLSDFFPQEGKDGWPYRKHIGIR